MRWVTPRTMSTRPDACVRISSASSATLEHGALPLRTVVRRASMPVLPVTQILQQIPGLRFMRDPTRGGLATVAHDIAAGASAGVRLYEESIPVLAPVASVCEILGYDPLYLASEGRVVAVLSPDASQAAVAALQAAGFADARTIGVVEDLDKLVVLQTPLGGERILPELEDDPLPRIC